MDLFLGTPSFLGMRFGVLLSLLPWQFPWATIIGYSDNDPVGLNGTAANSL